MKNTEVAPAVRTFNVTYSRHTSRAVVDGAKKSYTMTETHLLDWAAHTRACGHVVNIKFL